MSDEEKKAIDDLFALTHINGYIDLYTQREAKIHTLDLSKWQNGVKVLLNLIETQQKEIEELNSDLEVFKRALTDIEVVYNKNYISKDKIKSKIEEIGKIEAHKIKAGKILSREEYNRAEFAIESLVELMEE